MSDDEGVFGRIDYLTPEVFERKQQTLASDVYCFATLLWQAVTGVPPRGTALTTFSESLREELIPGAPAQLIDVLRRCWKRDPAQRPDISQVLKNLQKWCVRLGIEKCNDPVNGAQNYEEFKRATTFGPETIAFIEKRRAEHERERQASDIDSDEVFDFYDGLSAELVSPSFTKKQFHTRQIAEEMARIRIDVRG